MNHVALIGHLTRDVELQEYSSGRVAKTGLAVNERWTTRDGGTAERVLFIDVEAWNKTAELMDSFLSKGSHVAIEGKLRMDSWQQNDGSQRSKIYLVADRIHFLERRETPAAAATGPALDRSHSQVDDDPPF